MGHYCQTGRGDFLDLRGSIDRYNVVVPSGSLYTSKFLVIHVYTYLSDKGKVNHLSQLPLGEKSTHNPKVRCVQCIALSKDGSPAEQGL